LSTTHRGGEVSTKAEEHMLGKSKIVTFVATSRPERAKSFYGEALGLRLISDDPFAVVFDANGITLRVQKVRVNIPPAHTVLGWDVNDIRAEMEELSERGVSFERYEQLAQDESGVWTSPGGAKVAWFKDPDGNVLSLTQFAE
jgi:catechol 2,3-dioxygenase-like lactoylglutathione lyase family enzyme